MNRILLDAKGTWVNLDTCEGFDSKTENGILRQNALFITPEKNFVSRYRESKNSPEKHTVISLAEARSWFRLNKYSKEQTPEFLRQFTPDMELK